MFSEHPHAKSQLELSAKTAKPDIPYQKELQIKSSMIAQMRDKVTDLQADLAIHKAIKQDLKEEN